VLAGSSPPPGEAPPRSNELSPAELRVLSYLPGSLKADEIAADLYLSANTVGTHVRHIYAKLDGTTVARRSLAPVSSGSSRGADPDRGTHRRITNANHACK
jgi:DNA-binding NarL/FixJ family response regulator